tara:strand:+ start:1078 stop:1488 length:411 start_codon:yes stop_codon:yes gene_type:complete
MVKNPIDVPGWDDVTVEDDKSKGKFNITDDCENAKKSFIAFIKRVYANKMAEGWKPTVTEAHQMEDFYISIDNMPCVDLRTLLDQYSELESNTDEEGRWKDGIDIIITQWQKDSGFSNEKLASSDPFTNAWDILKR